MEMRDKKIWLKYENIYKSEKELVKEFRRYSKENFLEILIELEKNKMLLTLDKKNFFNILKRIELEMEVSNSSLEEIIPIYKRLLKLYTLKNISEIDLKGIKEIPLFEYTGEDWCDLYELLKLDEEIEEWIKKFISSLGAQKKKGTKITKDQLKVIENHKIKLEKYLVKIAYYKEVFKQYEKKEENILNLKEDEILEIEKEIDLENLLEEIEKEKKDIEFEKCKFKDILKEGIKNGKISIKKIKKIDFDIDEDAYDIDEAIEILEEKGVYIEF